MSQIEDPFILHVRELLAGWAPVHARRMFSSWGLYRGPVMFALASRDNVLYLKSGAALSEMAAGRELNFFTYQKPVGKEGKKKDIKLSYAEIPAELLDDAAQLQEWAEAAYQDALAGQRGNANPFRPKKLIAGRRPW